MNDYFLSPEEKQLSSAHKMLYTLFKTGFDQRSTINKHAVAY